MLTHRCKFEVGAAIQSLFQRGVMATWNDFVSTLTPDGGLPLCIVATKDCHSPCNLMCEGGGPDIVVSTPEGDYPPPPYRNDGTRGY